MHKGINKVILLGNIGADPYSYEKNSLKIATASLATTSTWKKEEKTEWHRLVFFGSLAEIALKYIKKGCMVYVEGKLTTNKYVDKNNIQKESTQIVVQEIQLLDKQKTSSSNPQYKDFDDEITFGNDNSINKNDNSTKKQWVSERDFFE